jgi:hypothetical protein
MYDASDFRVWAVTLAWARILAPVCLVNCHHGIPVLFQQLAQDSLPSQFRLLICKYIFM